MLDAPTIFTTLVLAIAAGSPPPPEFAGHHDDAARQSAQGLCHNDGDCDDGDPCTEDDCAAGQCLHPPIDCSESDDQCNFGLCVEGECVAVPLPRAPCDDENACTIGICDEDGACTPEATIECGDGGVCNPAAGECLLLLDTLDIMPGKCPNILRRQGGGFVRIVLSGTNELDAEQIDLTALCLSRASSQIGCVAPIAGHTRIRDAATPIEGPLCECHALRKDGLNDVDMRFDRDELISVLQLEGFPEGVEVALVLFARTVNGAQIAAGDCIELGKQGNP